MSVRMPQYAPRRVPATNEPITWRLRSARTWLSTSSSTRYAWRAQSLLGSSSACILPPPSLTSTVPYRFHTVSSPRLSYTPPSVRNTRDVNGVRCRSMPEPGENVFGSRRSSTGDSTGGKAEDAATAVASGRVGRGTSPTR